MNTAKTTLIAEFKTHSASVRITSLLGHYTARITDDATHRQFSGIANDSETAYSRAYEKYAQALPHRA